MHVLFGVSFLILFLLAGNTIIVVEAKWYAQICPTGSQEAVTIDIATGELRFVDISSVNDGNNHTNDTETHLWNKDPSEMSVDDSFDNSTSSMENHPDNEVTLIPSDGLTYDGGERRRRLRTKFSTGNPIPPPPPPQLQPNWIMSLLTYVGARHEQFYEQTPAIPAFSLSGRRHLTDVVLLVDSDENSNAKSKFNDGDVFFIRPCLCYSGPNRYTSSSSPDAATTSASASTAPELYLCHAEASYCGVPLDTSRTEPVACYTVKMQQVIARNAWPLILLWYFGLLVICMCTTHGHTASEYIKSCLVPNYHERFVNRLLDNNNNNNPLNDNNNSLGHDNRWWSWQRQRFEQNLILQAQWTWRQEEFLRERRLRQQGLPPPQLELKVKRWTPSNETRSSSTNSGGECNDPNENDMTSESTMKTFDLEPYANAACHASREDEGRAMQTIRLPKSETNNIDEKKASKDEEETKEDHVQQNDHEDLESDIAEDDSDSYAEPTCSICFVPLEDGDRIGDLSCKHEFHVDCLKTWMQRKNACPLCNVPLGNRKRRDNITIAVAEINNGEATEEGGNEDDDTQYYRDRNGRNIRRPRVGGILTALPTENRRIGETLEMVDNDGADTRNGTNGTTPARS